MAPSSRSQCTSAPIRRSSPSFSRRRSHCRRSMKPISDPLLVQRPHHTVPAGAHSRRRLGRYSARMMWRRLLLGVPAALAFACVVLFVSPRLAALIAVPFVLAFHVAAAVASRPAAHVRLLWGLF